MQPNTEAQDALLADLRLANTDHRALQVIELAFKVRNAFAPRGVTNLNDALAELSRGVDKVAG